MKRMTGALIIVSVKEIVEAFGHEVPNRCWDHHKGIFMISFAPHFESRTFG